MTDTDNAKHIPQAPKFGEIDTRPDIDVEKMVNELSLNMDKLVVAFGNAENAEPMLYAFVYGFAKTANTINLEIINYQEHIDLLEPGVATNEETALEVAKIKTEIDNCNRRLHSFKQICDGLATIYEKHLNKKWVQRDPF